MEIAQQRVKGRRWKSFVRRVLTLLVARPEYAEVASTAAKITTGCNEQLISSCVISLESLGNKEDRKRLASFVIFSSEEESSKNVGGQPRSRREIYGRNQG